MKNFRQCLIIMTIVFITILAALNVDRRCSDMYGTESKLADAAVNVFISTKEQWTD
ncbi:MAG: hypothetical protein IJB73_03475 [Firmicutes bacterium]|nr:hypothetical protein [Bacillota bacterium]